jgi:hypothetical protein
MRTKSAIAQTLMKSRPLLFDGINQPKPALYAVIHAVPGKQPDSRQIPN